jgi:DNA-directed RNA polymerase subunit K/omega
VIRPANLSNAFEFVVVASLRVRQLMAGSVPRVAGTGKAITTAQQEVIAGKVTKIGRPVGEAHLPG